MLDLLTNRLSMHNYLELKIWQEGRILVKEVYSITTKFPSEEVYGLTSQIRRAVVSIPSNIAEGTGRNTDKEFCRYLEFAIGSLFEVQTQIILANDLDYISAQDFNRINDKIVYLIRMLVKFRNSLQK